MNLNKLIKVKSTILILGETGTGKTTLAKKIHQNSDRKNKNFVTVNLAGLSDELFLSELFGHKKGSFTGALSDKKGFCDYVGSGTLFLDEVGDLTNLQQKYLLKLIDEKKYQPVGAVETKSFSGTIILATHRDLDDLVKKGKFREDLFFRIRIFTTELRPLREKGVVLINLLRECFQQLMLGTAVLGVSEEVIGILAGYSWPGNFREMKNTIEFMIINSEGPLVAKEALPQWIMDDKEVISTRYRESCAEFEKNYLIRQLALTGGKINETARRTGISKVTLIGKIKKYTIDLEYIKIINQSSLVSKSAI